MQRRRRPLQESAVQQRSGFPFFYLFTVRYSQEEENRPLEKLHSTLKGLRDLFQAAEFRAMFHIDSETLNGLSHANDELIQSLHWLLWAKGLSGIRETPPNREANNGADCSHP
jgi:hypothetical protein